MQQWIFQGTYFQNKVAQGQETRTQMMTAKLRDIINQV